MSGPFVSYSIYIYIYEISMNKYYYYYYYIYIFVNEYLIKYTIITEPVSLLKD